VWDGAWPGYRYQGTFVLPGRYYLDGVGVEAVPGAGHLRLTDVLLYDAFAGRALEASRVSGYLSDGDRFREAASTPSVRLFEVPASGGRARVVAKARLLAGPDQVLAALRGQAAPVDLLKEALLTEADARGADLPAGGRASKADVVRAEPGMLDARAEGPGLLLFAESWDPGWRASLDDRPARVLRVNHAQMGITLGPGLHRAVLRYHVPGLAGGGALCLAAVLGLAFAWARERRRVRGASFV
jgi:hypothetical protein